MIETPCENCGEEIAGVRWTSDGDGFLCQECYEIECAKEGVRRTEETDQ